MIVSAVLAILAAMRTIDELTEQEILALAICSEEEDGRVYADFAEGLREGYPLTPPLISL